MLSCEKLQKQIGAARAIKERYATVLREMFRHDEAKDAVFAILSRGEDMSDGLKRLIVEEFGTT